MTRDWSVRVHAQVEKAAAQVGLVYDFDAVVLANSFDAHRLAHLARGRGLQGRMQERLFAAYFTEGRDLGDRRTLVALAAEAGLDPAETQRVLAEGGFADEVRQDCREAEELGAEGVPFFVIDRRYGFTGAQPSEQVLDFLNEGVVRPAGGRARSGLIRGSHRETVRRRALPARRRVRHGKMVLHAQDVAEAVPQVSGRPVRRIVASADARVHRHGIVDDPSLRIVVVAGVKEVHHFDGDTFHHVLVDVVDRAVGIDGEDHPRVRQGVIVEPPVALSRPRCCPRR